MGLMLRKSAPLWVGKVGAKGVLVNARITGKGFVDYYGDLRGRAVYLEAKSSKVPTSFGLALIEAHQGLILREGHYRGCLTGVLIRLAGSFWLMPWMVLEPYWDAYWDDEKAPASIKRSAIEATCIPVYLSGKHLDLVGALMLLSQTV